MDVWVFGGPFPGKRILAQLREARLIQAPDDVAPLPQPPPRATGARRPTAWTIDLNDLQLAKVRLSERPADK
ncbi:hypothetical protein NP493_5817g00000 [Ridgeia piscesae]|uniref:Uncharacterized protein n=1 Tax=Ridgeia piscesae TaxID=27915 RepID=A0AAD9ITL0_RIDPI|nr:hypothetical protein NP493_5817g00000 [Ridgeia piscesae]